MLKEKNIFQSKNLNNISSIKNTEINDSNVCSVFDYRHQSTKVFDFLEKVGYDMTKKVAEYFHKTSDMHCHYENESKCLKSYNLARTRAFKYLKTMCEDYFLPVPEINMTFEDMQCISSKDGFVQGFIETYYQSDFCLVGDTQQAKRLITKLNKLELKNDLNHLFIDMTNGIDDINAFYFQNKMMHFYRNYETALVPYPLEADALKLHYKLLKLHYTFVVVQYKSVKYYFVVNEEQKECFNVELNEILYEFNLQYYLYASVVGEYKLNLNASYISPNQDNMIDDTMKTAEVEMNDIENHMALNNICEKVKYSGLLLDNHGDCFVLKDSEKCILNWVKSKGFFTTIRGMKPNQLRGIAYYYPHHSRLFK